MEEKNNGNRSEMNDQELDEVTGGACLNQSVKIYSGPGRNYGLLRYALMMELKLTGEYSEDRLWAKIRAPISGWVLVSDLHKS